MSLRTAVPARLAHLARPLGTRGSIHPVLCKPESTPAATGRGQTPADARPKAVVDTLPLAALPVPASPAPTPVPAPAPATDWPWPERPSAPAARASENREVRVGMARVPVRWLTRN